MTHDQEEALELADRVVVMSQGRIEQVGSSDDVYDRPNSPFVFSFIGDSASLPVTVEEGGICFQGEAIGIAPGPDDVAVGEGTLFFRPQDVVLVTDPAVPALEGRVATSRRLAGTRIADIDIGTPERPHHVEIEIPLDANAANGAAIRFRPTRWKLFGA